MPKHPVQTKARKGLLSPANFRLATVILVLTAIGISTILTSESSMKKHVKSKDSGWAQILFNSKAGGSANQSHPSLRQHQGAEGSGQSITWVLFTIPKPLQMSPGQLTAIHSWSVLRNPPASIYLIQDADVELQEVLELKDRFPSIKLVDENMVVNGKIRYDAVFERASREPVDAVVVVNADIVLYDDFSDALEFVNSEFPQFFMIGARYDSMRDISTHNIEFTKSWLDQLKSETVKKGALHSYGGSDYFAWKPTGYSHYSAVGGRIPPFVYGRSKADNWIIDRAIDLGNVEVIDATGAVTAIHMKHDYKHISDGNYVDSSNQNFWAKFENDDQTWNKHLAFSLGSFINQEGTPLHAPWALSQCTSAQHTHDKICMRKRLRPGICGCEYSPFVNKAGTDPQVAKGGIMCGTLSTPELVSHIKAFPILVKHRSSDVNDVILVGYRDGEEEMLLNKICQFDQLGITNYLIAVFDSKAMEICRSAVIPCVIATNKTVQAEQIIEHASQAVKLVQVLEILRMGTNVLWTEVESFWKANPIKEVVREMKSVGADIAIHAIMDDLDEQGLPRLNSDFFYAKSTPKVIEAFEQIVLQASEGNFSEQASFFRVLCGTNGSVTEDMLRSQRCYNRNLNLRTMFLNNHFITLASIDAPFKTDIAVIHLSSTPAGNSSELGTLISANMGLLHLNSKSCIHDPRLFTITSSM